VAFSPLEQPEIPGELNQRGEEDAGIGVVDCIAWKLAHPGPARVGLAQCNLQAA
jgi:hypothetical protein